jgi:hypothetical protein
MTPERQRLFDDFLPFIRADKRLEPIWNDLPQKEALAAVGKAIAWIPEIKPSYFNQWYCTYPKDRVGLTQRQSYAMYQLGLMFMDKVSRGRYYVPKFVEENKYEDSKTP